MKHKEHEIKFVEQQSPAAKKGIQPGDILLSIDNKPIIDVFDYRYFTQKRRLTILIRKISGEEKIINIIKSETQDLGLIFERGLMEDPKHCANKCVFCFIDQMPKNMRETLYFKDDDSRLSFLSGNYVTLTNMREEELDRIAFYHLSPINISVHATDPNLRAKLLGRQNVDVLPAIEKFYNAGIFMNFQVVLCKGLNDGINLDKTIKTLSNYRPQAISLSVVPAGLTKYRAGLYPLKIFTKEDAKEVVKQIESWQKKLTTFVFAADEFYIKAENPFPDYYDYEDFPQLENGVGMITLFSYQFDQAFNELSKNFIDNNFHNKNFISEISLVTGQAAAEFMRNICDKIMSVFSGIQLNLFVVENRFFGKTITVSGLLTGQDIYKTLNGKYLGQRLLIPANALRDDIFLDDMNIKELEKMLGVETRAVDIDGEEFVKNLFEGE